MFWKRKNKTPQNPDFEEFKKDISWFIKKSDVVELLETDKNHTLSNSFKKTFPKLAKLINKARVLNLKINDQDYKLFSWTNKNNISCGWLNKIESESDIQIIEEHQMLLNEIGGIKESYNQPEDSLCNNQNFLFIESKCSIGIGYWKDYYNELCQESNQATIEFDNLISFVQEANGALTLYNPKNKEVLLFSHDHCFDNVEFLNGQPEYTFHTINGIKYFIDYVEKLANEWIDEIK